MTKTLPRHIGIIMDGNGRWAKKQGKMRSLGHRAGVNAMMKIVEYAFKRGVQIVTVYALSTENLKRPKAEIDFLFSLFRSFFEENVKKLTKEGIRFRLIGDTSVLPTDIKRLVADAEALLPQETKKVFNVAIGYGSRAEIVRAVNTLLKEGKENISEEEFSSYLYTAGQADPDLIIRTGGEKRLSNFLLWQSAYSELYFTDVLFPDFSEEELEKAFVDYASRSRRFGKTQEQIEERKE